MPSTSMRVVAAVGMDADPVLRRAVGLVVPRPGRVPVVPDEVLAVLAQPHPRLHHAATTSRPARDRRGLPVTSYMASSHSATRFCLLAGSEKPSVVPPVVARRSTGSSGGRCRTAAPPTAPPSLTSRQAAARVPLLEDLLGQRDVLLGLGAVLRLQRGRLEDLAGHQHHRPQAHRLAEHGCRCEVRARRSVLAPSALGQPM